MTEASYHRSDDAQVYRQNASFVYSDVYTAPVLALLDPQPGDHILDLGCGSGELTLQLARAVGSAGRVLGIDASADMIAKARALSQHSDSSEHESVPLQLAVIDGHEEVPIEQQGKFGKVFSNAALHWMKTDPGKVLSNVHTALSPGGRFAAEMGGFLNCIGVRGQLHASLRARGVDPEPLDPWYFPTPAQYKSLLEKQGFTVKSCELVPRPTPLPTHSGLKGWLRTFAGTFLNALPDDKSRQEVVQEVENVLRPDCYDADQDQWTVMYVRLRILAFRAS